MRKLPFVYCSCCKNCSRRTFKNLFDDKAMLDCADCNGLSVRTIIPFILWNVYQCKLFRIKKSKD